MQDGRRDHESGLLRDVYGIPARVRAGYQARHAGPKSYLVDPDFGHVLVEVYDGGRWHAFSIPRPS